PGLDGFRCFALTVPLHRRGPHVGDGRTLTLRVAVQGARAPRGDLLFLSGGPGQTGLDFAPRLSRRLRGAADGYRLVFVDQRGTGATAIRCDALQRAVGTSDLLAPPARAVTACARTLGTARDAYATADTVADLDALRRALGDRTWVVGGISYGTFVAERLALAHPRTVAGLVLDSVVPQRGAELVERIPIRATGRVLRLVCRDAGDPCAGGLDPVADLRTLLTRDGSLGPRVLDAIVERSIGVPRLAALPAILHAAVTTDGRPLTRMLATARAEQTSGIPPSIYSTGLHAATLCADSPAPWPDGPAAPAAVRASAVDATSQRTGPAATAPFPVSTAFGQGLLVTCRAWPPTPAPPAPGLRARITAPGLLLAGDHDLSTPLEWARLQASRMDHAHLVVIRGAGHSVLSRAPGTTARDALRRFLAR
ncbi:MAG TPA: alpha/beta fold hydrolase, partial [Baekduia sp.]|nr:alpha/beta fold hydrolase [Baekduia sp.]